jgi:toxin ParE1/3/4
LKYRLTRHADADILQILRTTNRLFGKAQVTVYADIIARGIVMIAEDPARLNVKIRDEIYPGVRSFHLDLVKNKRGCATHLLYFLEMSNSTGEMELIVLNIVHEKMLPRRKLGPALRAITSERSNRES